MENQGDRTVNENASSDEKIELEDPSTSVEIKKETSAELQACAMKEENPPTLSKSELELEESDKMISHDLMEKPPSTSDIDPFAYLKRDEFTSEIFKIEINNLPKRCGVLQLKKKLNALGLKPGKVKILQNGLYAFVNFKCEEERQRALDLLDGHHWKGKDVKVKKANPAADPLLKKRKHDADMVGDGESQAKFAKVDDDTNISDRLNDVISPLWKVPYQEQLQTKASEIRTFMKRLTRDMEKNCYDPILGDWLQNQRKRHRGLCCNLLDIKASPVLNSYRNKCEFTIGQSPSGKDKTVGFRLGQYKGGSVSVVEPDDCLLITDVMKECTKSLQQFLQMESDKPGFDPETKAGNWKMVMMRTNSRSDIMMVVVFHPQKLSEAVIAEEKLKLQEYFVSGKGQNTPVTSLYFRAQSDRREQDVVICNEHLMGEKYIEEDLLDLKFRISSDSFFQVNTKAAEILYRTIGLWSGVSSNVILLDICCGTGTIGLTLAKQVKKVVGIELCREAVKDAEVNAEINGITNAQFYCGKAETLLPSIIGQYRRDDVVAVVDPPRAGLHQDVVRAIRKCNGVKRLVYISCKATGALTNLIDFTRSESRRVRGEPFRFIQAVPVDLFPHTQHVELIMLFERDTENYIPKTPAPQTNDAPTEDAGNLDEKSPCKPNTKETCDGTDEKEESAIVQSDKPSDQTQPAMDCIPSQTT